MNEDKLVKTLFGLLVLVLVIFNLAGCSPDVVPECSATIPNAAAPPGENASQLYHGNGALYTALWPEGVVLFEPGGPGEILADGTLVMKFPWWRGEGIAGPLQIEGRRLDGDSPPLGSEIPQGYGDSGFQASSLEFPAAGCWEVTGRVGEAELTFVVRVEVISE